MIFSLPRVLTASININSYPTKRYLQLRYEKLGGMMVRGIFHDANMKYVFCYERKKNQKFRKFSELRPVLK